MYIYIRHQTELQYTLHRQGHRHTHTCTHARAHACTHTGWSNIARYLFFTESSFLSHCLLPTNHFLSLCVLKHSWTFTQQNHIMDHVCSSVCAVLLSIQSCLLSLWNNHTIISCMPNSYWNYEMGIKWRTDMKTQMCKRESVASHTISTYM